MCGCLEDKVIDSRSVREDSGVRRRRECLACGHRFSTFESVGINQTKHSIYLNVIADISIVMPSRTENFAVTTEILVGEFVIVGSVPDTYLQSDIFGNKPNLSP